MHASCSAVRATPNKNGTFPAARGFGSTIRMEATRAGPGWPHHLCGRRSPHQPLPQITPSTTPAQGTPSTQQCRAVCCVVLHARGAEGAERPGRSGAERSVWRVYARPMHAGEEAPGNPRPSACMHATVLSPVGGWLHASAQRGVIVYGWFAPPRIAVRPQSCRLCEFPPQFGSACRTHLGTRT